MQNRLFIAAENRVDLNEVRVVNSWIADLTDELGSEEPYSPICRVGDWLVELVGYDAGSVSWVQNWGDQPLTSEVPYV